MGQLIALAFIVFTVVSAWGLVRDHPGVLLDIVQLCLPMAAFALVVGIASIKRLSKSGGNWIISGMILAQIVAMAMIGGTYWEMRGLWRSDGMLFPFIVLSVLISLILAIPAFVVNNRNK